MFGEMSTYLCFCKCSGLLRDGAPYNPLLLLLLNIMKYEVLNILIHPDVTVMVDRVLKKNSSSECMEHYEV